MSAWKLLFHGGWRSTFRLITRSLDTRSSCLLQRPKSIANHQTITTTRTARVWNVFLTSWRLRPRAADPRPQIGFVSGRGRVQGRGERGSRGCGVVRCGPPRPPSAVRSRWPRCPAAAGAAGEGRTAASRRRTPGDLRCSASDAPVTLARRGRPASHQYELEWRTRPRDWAVRTPRTQRSPPAAATPFSYQARCFKQGTTRPSFSTLNILALLLIPILQCGNIPSVSLSYVLPYIRAFRHIRGVLGKSTAADIAAASVYNRLDYANSVLYGSPSRCLTRLQRIQNSVARIVLQRPSLSSRDTL